MSSELHFTSINDTGEACITGVLYAGEVMPPWCCLYHQVNVRNFASVIETGNASFVGFSDTSNACISGVVITGDAPSEDLTVHQNL